MTQGFDNRIVSYEHIHSIDPQDFEKLIDAVNPKSGEVILDAMCGYGAVGKGILERVPDAQVFFLDESEVQIRRAKENLPTLPDERFIISSLPDDNFKDGQFDKVVIKMGLHEVPAMEQVLILQEFHRILKPSGKLIVWDIMLDWYTQKLFQDIIRKKDELSGFNLLTKERYFFKESEFLRDVRNAGFVNINEVHRIAYRFSSKKRLEQELKGDKGKLEQLNDLIRQRFNLVQKSLLRYEDLGDDIQFTIPKKIFVLGKS